MIKVNLFSLQGIELIIDWMILVIVTLILAIMQTAMKIRFISTDTYYLFPLAWASTVMKIRDKWRL